jgi:chemotaxis protein CheX
MGKVLLINCGDQVSQFINKVLGSKETILNEVFDHKTPPSEVRMLILEAGEDQEEVVQAIRKLRYSCNFRNIPLVVIQKRTDRLQMQPFVIAGATEVLSLQDPPAACRPILQGYLTASRAPLAEEMEYLNPFIENTLKVLKTMAATEAEFKELYFANDFRIFGDVSGIIGLSGKAEGTVVITFYWVFARKLISKMMSVEEDHINAEVIHDGVGELINMISGATKKEFAGKPYHFDLSLPTVVMGAGHQIGHPEEASIAVLIFESQGNPLALQICLKPKRPKTTRVHTH